MKFNLIFTLLVVLIISCGSFKSTITDERINSFMNEYIENPTKIADIFKKKNISIHFSEGYLYRKISIKKEYLSQKIIDLYKNDKDYSYMTHKSFDYIDFLEQCYSFKILSTKTVKEEDSMDRNYYYIFCENKYTSKGITLVFVFYYEDNLLWVSIYQETKP